MERELLWDGDQLLAELDSSGNRLADYVYLPGTVDQPFAETLGATVPTSIRYHQQDALGNVMGTVESGAVSQTVSYDAWGVPTVQGNSDNSLLWKGLLWLGGNTSLYYMRNRWYDPDGGRFVNEDPAGFEGGINLYAFSGNDPVNGSDPFGLDAESCYSWTLYTYTPDYGSWELVGVPVSCGGGGEAPDLPFPQLPGGPESPPHGGGGGHSGAADAGRPTPVRRDWAACASLAAQTVMSGALDVTAYRELRAAGLAINVGAELLQRAQSRLVRNGGFFSGNVFRDLTNGTRWVNRAHVGFAGIWNGIRERGLMASVPMEVIPIAGTGYLGYKAAQACLPSGG